MVLLLRRLTTIIFCLFVRSNQKVLFSLTPICLHVHLFTILSCFCFQSLPCNLYFLLLGFDVLFLTTILIPATSCAILARLLWGAPSSCTAIVFCSGSLILRIVLRLLSSISVVSLLLLGNNAPPLLSLLVVRLV